jgi:hypothetical protein
MKMAKKFVPLFIGIAVIIFVAIPFLAPDLPSLLAECFIGAAIALVIGPIIYQVAKRFIPNWTIQLIISAVTTSLVIYTALRILFG